MSAILIKAFIERISYDYNRKRIGRETRIDI